MGNFGGWEMILIVLALLLLFGGKKIPELMRGMGKGIREFNDAKSNIRREIEDGATEKERAERDRAATNAASTSASTNTTV